MQEEIEQIVVETYKKAVKDFANFLIDKDYIDGFLMPDIVVEFFNNIEKG